MGRMRSLGREFGWLWAAYAASTAGTWFAFGAFPLIAVLVLHAGPAQVSALSAASLAAGALLTVPVGPWVEYHRKRPVMIAMDLLRFLALLSLPAAYAVGMLGFGQLLAVAVLVAAAGNVFNSASGAYLKSLVAGERLLMANARFEATTWSATAIGPPLGGAAIGMFGPLTTVLADAASYLLSALGIGAIGGGEPRPMAVTSRLRTNDVIAGWRHILAHPRLRPLFFNTCLVNALILATEPVLAIFLLRDLGFAPWQYGLAFGAPCIGGLAGSRLARPLVARFGEQRVLRAGGILRVFWPVGLAFTGHGAAGVALVILVEFGLITCCSVFNPVLATYRLEQTAADRVSRVLSAWTITSRITTAALTACWGLLAAVIGARYAIAVAGVLMLATPLLLPRREHVPPRRVAVAEADETVDDHGRQGGRPPFRV